MTVLRGFTHIVRWLKALPADDSFDSEALSKLALHLLASVPACFKTNPQAADALKVRVASFYCRFMPRSRTNITQLAALWARDCIPCLLSLLQNLHLSDQITKHVGMTVQSISATYCKLLESTPQLGEIVIPLSRIILGSGFISLNEIIAHVCTFVMQSL